jgi:RNA polymerase sigma-70 factor (ECF subfamily)
MGPVVLAAPPAVQRTAFEHTFDEHAPYVWRILRRLGVPDADVDDVCQEVFLVVDARLGSFEGRSSMRTWIYGICVRKASEYRRRPHRRHESIVADPPETSTPALQHEELERKRTLARLDEALLALDEGKRAVFVLYEIEQLSMPDVAAACGCPLQTAYSRLHAARRFLEAKMGEDEGERT